MAKGGEQSEEYNQNSCSEDCRKGCSWDSKESLRRSVCMGLLSAQRAKVTQEKLQGKVKMQCQFAE